MNDSSTIGYVQPFDIGGELNDAALRVFLQQVVSGVTGLQGALVFPLWQPEPPLLPAHGIDWAAVGVQRRRRDVFSYIAHESTGQGDDVQYRNMLLEVLCSFYGPNCENNAELFSAGLLLAQNREQLEQQGYGVVEVEDAVTTADRLHNKWVTRVDQVFCLRRAQEYRYNILNLVAASATVQNSENQVVASVVVMPQVKQAALPLFGWGLNNTTIAGWGNGNWK